MDEHCYESNCTNQVTHRLWDGDDHISVCSDDVEKYKRPQDELELIEDK